MLLGNSWYMYIRKLEKVVAAGRPAWGQKQSSESAVQGFGQLSKPGSLVYLGTMFPCFHGGHDR